MKRCVSYLLAICSSLCLIGCGEEEITPCASHTWGDWQTQKAATCTVAGLDKRVCSVCGEEERKVIKPAHDYKDMPAKAPTCLEEGYKSYVYCGKEGCNYTMKKDSDVIAAAGHNWIGYGCSECEAKTDEYYLTNFSRGFDNETITSYSRVGDLTTGALKSSYTEYFSWMHDHGNQYFHLLHREGYDGVYWRKGGLTLDFATGTFKFLCTDMHQDLGDAKMRVFMIFKDVSGATYTKPMTVESKTPKSGGWYECIVKLPDGLKAKTVISTYFHADAFNVDDIRAVPEA